MRGHQGIILPDEAPHTWGFTSRRFRPDSYLWKDGDRIIISLITATPEGKGHFRQLVKAIESAGYKIDVPTPVFAMPLILKKWGFVPRAILDEKMGEVELWSRPESIES